MGKEIRADIIIGGHADASLKTLGDSVAELGRQVNEVSQILINFGVEATDNYSEYQDAMLDAQVALATTYTNASDLSRVMAELDKNAMKWASDSKFTTQDVANAISNAAHAGWDLEEILNGIPAAMKIAQAGGMDLSTGLEYLVDIANAAKIDFGDLSAFVDIWAYAANSSSTDIDEMGAAMQKMGATMQFVNGDMEALATMLAVLANNGTKGTDAGTLLRNSLIRLIAPTKKAADAMDGLNLSADEADEIYADADAVAAAGKALEEAGFSAYDASGKLKPMLQIWEELAQATAGMTDEKRNSVISAIFPTRTMTGALALLDAASNGWGGLYEQLQNASNGYSAFAAAIMESGLGGSLRHLESVWQALSTKTGGALSGQVSEAADALSEMIQSVSGMDDASFAGLVGGLEAIAVAGPALLGTAAGIKLMAMLFGTGPGGWLALAGIGVAALAAGLYSYNEAVEEANFEEQFGSLSYDETALGQFLAGMQQGYNDAAEGIERYNQAVDSAFQDYTQYSGKMKQTLLTQLITNAALTPEDEATLQGLGQKMQEAIIAGVNAQQGADEAMVAMLSGDGEGAEVSDPLWAAILETLEFGYEDAKARAAELGQGLRDAITSAFADGALTPEELENINSLLMQMNEIEAERIAGDDAASRARLLMKGQTIGLDGLKSAAAEVYATRDAIIASKEGLFYGEGGTYSSYYAAARARVNAGQMTQDDMDAQMAFLESEYLASLYSTNASYDKILEKTFSAALNESDLGAGWRILMKAAADGYISAEENQDYYNTTGDSRTREQTYDVMNMLIDSMGGIAKVQELSRHFNSVGDTESAAFYDSMLSAWALSKTVTGSSYHGIGYWMNQVGLGGEYGYGGEGGTEIPVTADTSAAQEAIDALNGQTVTVNVDAVTGAAGTGGSGGGKGLFAEGGRADEASIFGEAGPEWAIPEEHSQRTAELLTAAAKASGFTWPELLARNGGLNAGGGAPWTLIYSPTINAGSGGDLESVLRADKERLSRWMQEQRLHDEIEVYA